MLPIETLLTFAVAATLLSLSPGPSNLYIMARTMSSGHTSGIAAASGMAIGSMLYVLATAFGLAAVFSLYPTSYIVLKLTGAAYLIYLGASAFWHEAESATTKPKLKSMSRKQVFNQSIVVELTNPKTALFFMAFLPQFADPAAGNLVLQLIILGLLYAVIAFSSDLLMVFMSHKLGRWLSTHPAFPVWQDRVSGSILIGLGTFIAMQEIDL
ncbi:LysE family translocator [Aliiglaciecola litoralis]|uniref:LysE family translocator n=1 Tax=Aliiglaciecola litoralis TaxID=582857 RepID=A0ABN1LS23_9ALTE